jgi:small subunit ribosomal protein S16
MGNRFACVWPHPATLPGGELLAVKIRLARAGAKKAPFYRIVAADSRSPRDGRFIEILGRYNPRMEPSFIELDVERTDEWLGKGAQMTETVAKLYEIAKNPDAAAPAKETKLSKKAQAKAAAKAEADAAPAVEPAADEAPAEAESEEASVEEAEEAPAEEPAEAAE